MFLLLKKRALDLIDEINIIRERLRSSKKKKKKRLSDTDIGLTSEYYRNINLDSVIPALSPILELFKKKQQI